MSLGPEWSASLTPLYARLLVLSLNLNLNLNLLDQGKALQNLVQNISELTRCVEQFFRNRGPQ